MARLGEKIGNKLLTRQTRELQDVSNEFGREIDFVLLSPLRLQFVHLARANSPVIEQLNVKESQLITTQPVKQIRCLLRREREVQAGKIAPLLRPANQISTKLYNFHAHQQFVSTSNSRICAEWLA